MTEPRYQIIISLNETDYKLLEDLKAADYKVIDVFRYGLKGLTEMINKAKDLIK